MTKHEENIIIPRWFLENIENTLRIENNINLDKEGGETCQDRNIRQSLNGIRKLLKGEELTGRERFEKLQPSLPSNLDEAAYKKERDIFESLDKHDVGEEKNRVLFGLLELEAIASTFSHFGAEWMAGQFKKIEDKLVDWYETNGVDYCHGISTNESFEVPEGFYIRKK